MFSFARSFPGSEPQGCGLEEEKHVGAFCVTIWGSSGEGVVLIGLGSISIRVKSKPGESEREIAAKFNESP